MDLVGDAAFASAERALARGVTDNIPFASRRLHDVAPRQRDSLGVIEVDGGPAW